MSNTTPLSPRAPLQPQQMFALPWAVQPTPQQTARQPAADGFAAFIAVCKRCARALLADWRDRRQIRATRLALMNLDDQTLRDIGFVRAEINSVAAESHGGVSVTRDRLLARGIPPGL